MAFRSLFTSILKNRDVGIKFFNSRNGIIIKSSFGASRMSTWGGDLIKPPIQVFGIEGRYASALYSAASKQNALEVVEKELLFVLQNLKTDPKFKDFILNPTIKRSLKGQTLRQIAATWNLSATTSNLLVTMAENGRLKKLEAVIKSYESIMSSHRGEIKCEIISAAPLSAEQKKKLEGVLKAFSKNNENVLLKTIIDPNILGGIIVSIGDKYIDMSVSKKVKKYCDIIAMTI